MSLPTTKARQREGMGPFLPEAYHAPYPTPYRCDVCDGSDCTRHSLPALDELFARRLAPRDTAALFVEPIQGEGGYVVSTRRFPPGPRALCERHGIVLVLDEVQSGIGRTGRMFACEHEGVVPDVLVTAK